MECKLIGKLGFTWAAGLEMDWKLDWKLLWKFIES
jgi:hypothetical protein